MVRRIDASPDSGDPQRYRALNSGKAEKEKIQ
jgi:hypothetical protein